MDSLLMSEIRVIDSHTAGEPTRIICDGGPDLGTGSMAERLERFQKEFDHIRRAVVTEPRASDAWVGGLICHPNDPTCITGIIFFNNDGYLGMCGHGLIGLMETFKHLRKISSGIYRIETPVGVVTAELMESGEVTFQNVPSYRYLSSVEIEVADFGRIVGDVAWGGNWFFLTTSGDDELDVRNVPNLTRRARAIRNELLRSGITGHRGAAIDHIELMSSPVDIRNHSRNFVLCPGGAYDRSPCGTGTSAKLACLAADGRLKPGEEWRQESIIGSVFKGFYQPGEPLNTCLPSPSGPPIIPSIMGRAHIIAESILRFDPEDHFIYGIVQ